MNKLAELIANGTITVEELAAAKELIKRAELVSKGLRACRKTISFPFGTTEVECYRYIDSAGEYEAHGTCTSDGVFKCSCNWGGWHEIGRVNLTDFSEVFMAFENCELAHNLQRFLERQIRKTAI